MLSILPARLVRALLLTMLPTMLLASCGGSDAPTTGTPAPATSQMIAGNDQSATVGSSLANPFVVEVLDANGRAVGGQTVAWTIIEGTGTLSAPTSVTNASGEARAFLQLGSTPGMHRVRASIGALPPVNFNAMALARAAAQVSVASGNGQSAIMGASLSQPIVARVLDATGAAVPGATVTFVVTSGGGTVQTPSVLSDASGQASTTWRLGTSMGAQTVVASVTGATAATFTATARESGASSLVIIGGSAQTGTVSSTLPQPLTVRLLDAQGAPVAGAPVFFTATGSSGTLTPSSATTGANGEASTSWRLGTTVGAQTVTASSSGTSPVSFSATAVAGAASQLTIVSGNSQVASGSQPLPLPLVVRVADAFGNAVAGSTVTFGVTSGGGSIAPTTVTSDATGRATATWTLGAGIGAQGATATVAGIGNAAFTATAAPTIHGLAHRVVDAEYNAPTGRIITVSANPSRLHILDPETRTVQTVDLPQTPNAVSVRADGLYAAVGHNAWVSYVNLTTRQVERVYPVSTDAIDLVLASNGWVHVFPRADQWVTIHSIALATGLESKTGGTIRAGTLVKMHPSGSYIYGANNGLSPSDFEKYDIRAGAATVMYDSPYHGDHAFDGDLWISEDGLRLFARSGKVFRSSDVRAEDMLYAGTLQGMTSVGWATQSTAAGRVFALPGSSFGSQTFTSELRVYDSAFLTFRGAQPLPQFVAPGAGSFRAEGRFVFSSTSGQRVYVLVRAESASGLAQDWGLVIYNLADLP
ncbi:MAG: Ig-like domain-containing protein [Gemmatimonadota bacterium]